MNRMLNLPENINVFLNKKMKHDLVGGLGVVKQKRRNLCRFRII